ncbi:MAG: DNA-processing protein DprA [Candidatus Eremiobacteraeota bacterium]|nr:DNA-processing protein DprA [Candidatus Eremiobacteraeota bacterium]MBV9055888.1 DNA-processing protein DprA [Candidatus Eremiobacteraeota bacterium]
MTSGRKLYVRGELLSDGVAIIGSRTPPPPAARFAYSLASRLGQPVIAGLALGIDAAAHRGSMVGGTPTVAFVGYGFGCTYPPEHAALEEAIVAAGGAVATLSPPGTPVTDAALIERDRLQAEYARAVVLVCSERNRGAMHTMRFARELGKPRFAVIPPHGAGGVDVWAGNRVCLEEGATPLPFDVECAVAVLL